LLAWRIGLNLSEAAAEAWALAALTEKMGGRPSAMRPHYPPPLPLKKSWPVLFST
jgi:hypothetical protein